MGVGRQCATRRSAQANMEMPQSATDQDVLSDYWKRLDSLVESEWTDFYHRVRSALMLCPAKVLSALPDSRESYIHEFFVEKLFFKAQRARTPGIETISGGSLCRFFRRYLIDKIRARARESPLDDNAPDRDEKAAPSAPDNAIEALLAQIGGRETLAISVNAFLANLEDWALLMLRGHFCADDGDAIPMSKLCKGIPAYHYKAQKLGITLIKNPVTFLGYEHTRIGQWVKELGVDIVPENRSEIRFLLEVLCLDATVAAGEGSP